MSMPMPLRRRVALWFTLLGLLLTVPFSISVMVIAEKSEDVIAAELLRGQAEDYSLRLSNGLVAELPRTRRLTGYREGAPDLPAAFASLPPGFHDDVDSEGSHVGVFDTTAGRLRFVIDLSDIEALERLLNGYLAGLVLLGTASAGWLGWWFAGLALHPVRTLVESVDALPVQPRRSRLAAHTSQDELGRLARAIDAYQARLVDADTREQAFFADASHELRTPLTVIQGVTEVMLDDAGDDPAHQARLRRLERGVRDLGNLMEALLGVARRSTLQPEPANAREFLREAALTALPDKASSVLIDASGSLVIPRREGLLLISSLLRKLAQQPPDAVIHVRLDDRSLLIEKPLNEKPLDGTEPAGDGESTRSDSGRGSALLDRLAQRLGWQVHFETPTRIRIHLHD